MTKFNSKKQARKFTNRANTNREERVGNTQKNRVFCLNSGRSKMAWETEKEVKTFLKFNSNSIPHEGELRAYFCEACSKWHFTSKPWSAGYDRAAKKRVSDMAQAYRDYSED